MEEYIVEVQCTNCGNRDVLKSSEPMGLDKMICIKCNNKGFLNPINYSCNCEEWIIKWVL